jgi:hypothetical protein
MKTSWIVAMLLTMALLMASVAFAQTGPNLPGLTVAPAGAASGGRYRLSSLAWQVKGSAAGGGYLLQGPVQPALNGSGCCCTYLPCVLRY